MSELVAAVVFGVIGLTILAAVVYILGFILTMVVAAVHEVGTHVHLPEVSHHHHGAALHH